MCTSRTEPINSSACAGSVKLLPRRSPLSGTSHTRTLGSTRSSALKKILAAFIMQARCEIREYPSSDVSRSAFRGRTSRVGYYLGIDGGGTKTTCVVGDENRVLATATAGPSNIIRVGGAIARESLQQAVGKACAEVSVDPRKITRTCIGVAGAGRRKVSVTVMEILSEIVGGAIEVVPDSTIALHAAFGDGAGIIVIAGTGSI